MNYQKKKQILSPSDFGIHNTIEKQAILYLLTLNILGGMIL